MNKFYNVELRHDFRHDTSFEDNLKVLEEKYRRRIIRVNKRISAAHSILLVHAEQKAQDDTLYLQQQFSKLQKMVAGI